MDEGSTSFWFIDNVHVLLQRGLKFFRRGTMPDIAALPSRLLKAVDEGKSSTSGRRSRSMRNRSPLCVWIAGLDDATLLDE